jgi:hypothetical protein
MSPPTDTLVVVAKDVVVRLRATSEDLKRWQAAADADQRSLSDWLRIVANAAISPVRAGRKPAPKRAGR